MDAALSLHPSDQTLSSYGLGKLDESSAEAVNKHLEACPDCRKRVAEASADRFLGRVREVQEPLGESTSGQSQAGGALRTKAGAAPPAETLPPGLADNPDYEIKRELGRGGMGVVYLVHNTLMGRDEVLKVMARQIMERRGVLERFLREIRAVAKLRHPNIVTAHSAVRLGESIVFAMEYVEGLDLARMVKAKGPLPVGHACNFAYQAALGLQHAYEEGLVHRDIKPANLMLSRKGDRATVKVLDFGLAKVTREEKIDGGLTSEGQALGTPDYIAPEQILDAQSADIRADIYSLGGTLYYLLTGRPPFQATSLYDMYQAHISRDAEPLNLVRPEVPAELGALVTKMMAKHPGRRFQTPGEVAQALTPFFKKSTATTKPELSVPGAAFPSQGGAGVGLAATETATNVPKPVREPRPAAKTSSGEARWENLIDFEEAGHTADALPRLARTISPARRPPWVRRSVVAGLSLFGLLVAWAVIIRITTKDGKEVVIKVPENTAKVTVETSTNEAPRPPAVMTEPEPMPRADAGVAAGEQVILAKLEQAIPMKYAGGAPISKLIEDIQRATKTPDGPGIAIYVDPIGLLEAEKTMASPITLDLEGVALKDTLSLALGQIGLAFCVKDGLLIISDPESAAGEQKLAPVIAADTSAKTKAVLAKLGRPVAVPFVNKTPLEGVLMEIKRATKGPKDPGIPVYVDPNGLQEAEKDMTSPVCIDVEGVPLRTTLRLLLKQLGLRYYVKDGLLIISDEASVAEALKDTDVVTGSLPAKVVDRPAPTQPAKPPATPSHSAAPTAVVLSGSWRAEGTELVQSGGQGTILLGETPLSSYDLRFRGKIVSGNEGFVALFHRTSDDNLRFFHVGELAGKLADAGVLFEGKEGGQSKPLSTIKGRWYDVLIKVRGPEYWCYLDRQELFHGVDQRFTKGRVGLATWAANARYSKIVITTPEGKTLWSGMPVLP